MKNSKYLNFIRGRDCIICSAPAEPHHENGMLGDRGLALTNDYLAVPLCRFCHEDRHINPAEFKFRHGDIMEKTVIKQLIEFIERGRK